MAQFSVVRFDRIGLALVGHGEVDAPIESQVLVGRQSGGCQDTDDRDNDHQFDKGKALLNLLHE